jgi:hypothetical protein
MSVGAYTPGDLVKISAGTNCWNSLVCDGTVCYDDNSIYFVEDALGIVISVEDFDLNVLTFEGLTKFRIRAVSVMLSGDGRLLKFVWDEEFAGMKRMCES